ncbi:MAG: serine hydrolase, partial [Acidobacteria bacterium]|nr:serine hydrolase [Acidobacteriota bacterium]
FLMLFISSLSVAAQDAPLQGMDEYVNKAMKEWEVPGLAIAVVKDDKVVFAKGYGVRELGKPDAVDEKTIFAIGSSSKAFTSASIAMLMDEKKLKWDDHVSEYLPEFQLFDPYVTREMTVRDLLTHRIGLERGDQLWYATDFTRDEVLHRVRYLEPSSSVRSRFGYQNIMYLAAGQIIPSITKKSWDDFVAERIFTPLGMRDSSTSITSLSKSNDVSTPHLKIDDKVTPIAWRMIDNIGPAGSINSNVMDMAQWLRLQLGNGKFAGKQLISEAAIKEMHTPQTVIRREGPYTIFYPEAHFMSYGMGWFLSDFRGKKLVEHGGAIDGMRASVMMIPEENVGIVILTNMNGTLLPQFLCYRIFDAFMGNEPRDYAGDGFKGLAPLMAAGDTAQKKAEAERVKGTSPSVSLEKYAGTYRSKMYGDVEVKFSNGKLSAHYGTNFNGDLSHWNYDTFKVTWRDVAMGEGLMQFGLDVKGNVSSLKNGGMGEFKRVAAK